MSQVDTNQDWCSFDSPFCQGPGSHEDRSCPGAYAHKLKVDRDRKRERYWEDYEQGICVYLSCDRPADGGQYCLYHWMKAKAANSRYYYRQAQERYLETL